jgi:hypothetical protein
MIFKYKFALFALKLSKDFPGTSMKISIKFPDFLEVGVLNLKPYVLVPRIQQAASANTNSFQKPSSCMKLCPKAAENKMTKSAKKCQNQRPVIKIGRLSKYFSYQQLQC